jgi:hypothetical protein
VSFKPFVCEVPKNGDRPKHIADSSGEIYITILGAVWYQGIATIFSIDSFVTQFVLNNVDSCTEDQQARSISNAFPPLIHKFDTTADYYFNPLNPELNPIC